MVQREGMVAVAVVAMLMQAMVLSVVGHTALAMPAGAVAVVGLLPMIGLMMTGAMVGGMHTAVGAQQHQSGKEHILVLALKETMQDLQPGRQAHMKDQWQAYLPDSPHTSAPI